MSEGDKAPARGQSLLSVIKSVSASMFGVQSSKKHEEDFARGSPRAYIAVGLIATVVFVLAVWGVVRLVVSVTQPH